MAWLILMLVVVVYSASLVFSYSEAIRESRYFFVLSMLGSFTIGTLSDEYTTVIILHHPTDNF